MDYWPPIRTNIHGNSQEKWILNGGGLTLNNLWGSLTGEDGADNEMNFIV